MNLLRRFQTLLARRRHEREMAEEMNHHLEELAERHRTAGLSAAEARHAALREFGNVASVQERAREQRGAVWLDHLGKDLRRALRGLVKSPGFTVTALLTLGLCVGANLAIFAVVDAVLLRPLPFPDADRLVTMHNTYPKAGVNNDGSSITNYYERRGQIEAFAGLALYSHASVIVGDPGSTQRMAAMRVSPEFFATLGSTPAAGRTFAEAETNPGTADVAILTDSFWRQHFNADPAILGQELRVDGRLRMIIGILAPGFRFLSSEAGIFLPFTSSPEQRAGSRRHSGGGEMTLVARLNPGRSLADAQRQIDRHNDRVAEGAADAKLMADAGFRTVVVSLRGAHVSGVRRVLWLTQAGGVLLLVIGAVNLINLLLIRASGRAKEVAVRQVLGASRRHVVGEALTESFLLAAAGGALGVWFGLLGVKLLTALGADRLPLGAQISPDIRWVLAALGGVIVLGVSMAVPAVWFNLRQHLAGAMQAESRGSAGNRAAQRLRHGFIVAQITLAFVLLAGAGLLGLSFQKALATSPGFRAEGILTTQIILPGADYRGTAEVNAFIGRLLEGLSEAPGVAVAGVSRAVPLDGTNSFSAVTVKNQRSSPGEPPRGCHTYGVGGDYFGAMGIPLRGGRFLTEDDHHRKERVCVVDEDFAARHWPEGEAVGRQLFAGSTEGSDAEAFTVVGVVGAVKQASLTDKSASGAVYIPFQFRGDPSFSVVVRTGLAPEAMGAALRRAIHRVAPDLPAAEFRTMESRVADSLAGRRSPALLTGIFAVTALLLTMVGTYGVLGYAVAQRQREISVRMALGAMPGQIRSQFLSLGLRLLRVGVGLGLLGAVLAGQAMQGVLYGVPGLHWPTLAATAAALGLVTLAACLLPAHRAAKVDPLVALKAE